MSEDLESFGGNIVRKIGEEIGKIVMRNAKKDYDNSAADAEIDSLKNDKRK